MIIFEFLMETTYRTKAFIEELKAIPGVDRVDVSDNRVMVVASTKEAQEKCRLLYCLIDQLLNPHYEFEQPATDKNENYIKEDK